MAFCQSCQSYIKNKFNSIDVNHNGKITLKELLNQAGKAPFENKTVEDLTRLYFKIDPDHNGVALNEWMKYYSEKYPPNSSVDSCARCETIKSYKK